MIPVLTAVLNRASDIFSMSSSPSFNPEERISDEPVERIDRPETADTDPRIEHIPAAQSARP
jgi:hypothetical protein